jgi:hypothetical protein
MSTPNEPRAQQHLDEPMMLWNKVVKARSVVASRRRDSPIPSSSPGYTAAGAIARADLLSALEAYAASLTRHRRPIPHALRDELRIKRLTR